MEVQAGRSGRRAIISRARFRRPTSMPAMRRCTARVRRTILPGLLIAGTVAFCPAAVAALSATPSPSPSPTSVSPTPEPSSSSPSSSPTPSPTSPAPTPSPTSPTPTPSPTSPRPTPSRTSPKPSPAPTSVPAPTPSPTRGSEPPHTRSPAPSPSPSSWPAPTWPSFAAHTARHAHAKKGPSVTAGAKAPATSDASAGAFTPVASIGADRPQPDGTGPAVVAMFAALLGGFALLTGRWLRLSLRRRAHPPRHAFRTPAPSGGHRRPRGSDDNWDF